MAKVPLSATRKDRKSSAPMGRAGRRFTRRAIWLTDYDAGDVYRFNFDDVLAHCPAAQRAQSEPVNCLASARLPTTAILPR